MPLLQDTPPNTMAEALDALDDAAKQLTRAAVAIGFSRSIHLVYAHLPNRAVTLSRLLFAGGTPLGLVGYRDRQDGREAYYTIFPDTGASAEGRTRLREIARTLGPDLPAYTVLPKVPSDAVPFTGSLDDLLEAARQVAVQCEDATLVFAARATPQMVEIAGPACVEAARSLLAAGAIPVGVIGRRLPEKALDGGQIEAAHLFQQYQGTSWAPAYLDSLLEVQAHLRWAQSGERRPGQSTERAKTTRTARELVTLLDAAATRMYSTALLILVDDGAGVVHAEDPNCPALLTQYLEAGGTPVGITGFVDENGRGRLAQYEVFPEYADAPWARYYLQGLTDRLQSRLDALPTGGRA